MSTWSRGPGRAILPRSASSWSGIDSAVYRAALAALGSPADAEDAAQDAFLLAYRRLDSFRGDASFKTWLLTHHMAPGDQPAAKPDAACGGGWSTPRTEEEAESVMAGIAAAGPSPEQAAEQEQLRRGIREAIRALSPKLRDALLLAQAGEYSYEEIGAMLHAPLGTIKWRVSEARRVIRKRLQERGYGDVG